MVYTLWPKRRYRGLLPAPQRAPQLKYMTFVQLEAWHTRGVHTRRGANWGQHRDRQGHDMPCLGHLGGRGSGAPGGSDR